MICFKPTNLNPLRSKRPRISPTRPRWTPSGLMATKVRSAMERSSNEKRRHRPRWPTRLASTCPELGRRKSLDFRNPPCVKTWQTAKAGRFRTVLSCMAWSDGASLIFRSTPAAISAFNRRVSGAEAWISTTLLRSCAVATSAFLS